MFSISDTPIRGRKLGQIVILLANSFSSRREENDERDENTMLESDFSGDFSAV